MVAYADPLAGTVDWLIIGFWLTLYFIPNIVATQPKHKNLSAFAVLNFFLGWTIIGWIMALFWALVR